MIGLFDSGSGGLTVLAACADALPDRHFVYLGDHAQTPYGPRSADDIQSLTRRGVAHLFARGCRLVLIACNTAAAVALRPLQQTWLAEDHADRRVLGVHVPLIEALTGTQWAHPVSLPRRPGQGPRTIAVFATPATVASGAFERETALRAEGLTILSQSCPGLADAIEAGEDAEALTARIQGFWNALAQDPRAAATDSAVLACTHYPLVAPLFADVLPRRIQILVQPHIVAGALVGYLARNPHLSMRRDAEDAGVTLLTTGDPASLVDASPWLPARFRRFERVRL
ncbi:hypothetical protein CCR85_04775 [Rhodothalassium salexigens]|uniref:glutamate racemase n=1 Tax=Rhodothalassium salexigens TaxID=1086 RepID=UPI0019132E21|nr:aspartate/glutamate racemase family protein [Rhodothalassium salexigens]MBK5910806.1 hypothetical protein [Rhodothalassium salexigens]MBK5920552.1 hypothetical protein [Rhodothalassium salexigens]